MFRFRACHPKGLRVFHIFGWIATLKVHLGTFSFALFRDRKHRAHPNGYSSQKVTASPLRWSVLPWMASMKSRVKMPLLSRPPSARSPGSLRDVLSFLEPRLHQYPCVRIQEHARRRFLGDDLEMLLLLREINLLDTRLRRPFGLDRDF